MKEEARGGRCRTFPPLPATRSCGDTGWDANASRAGTGFLDPPRREAVRDGGEVVVQALAFCSKLSAARGWTGVLC